MAMQLTTTLPSGQTANYWKITSFTTNRLTSTIAVRISVYATQAARQSNLQPCLTKNYTLSGTDFTTATAATNLVQALYTYLKAQSDFTGEVDC
jgi:uncharacterized protein YpmS